MTSDAVRGRHRDHVESRIASIWEDVLGLDLVMPDDDFFDLGGDSVRALLCCSRISVALGATVRLADFFESPTPARLAEVLRASSVEVEVGVVPIADVDLPGAPLFFVHAATGEVMFLRSIKAGTFDRPVHGIRSAGFDPGRASVDSLEEMAADYVDQICRLAPDGPVLLAGYSAGAVIAFEMAVQLDRAGRPPPFLGLVDPPIPGPDPEFAGSFAELKRHRAAFLMSLYDLPSGWVGGADAAEALRGAGAIPHDWSADYFDRTLAVWASNSLAVTGYVPTTPYRGRAHLYVGVAPDDGDAPDAAIDYWRDRVAPASQVRRIDADHLGIMNHPSLFPCMRKAIEGSLVDHGLAEDSSA